MTDAPTLAEWLLERIAEDEAAARAASPSPWTARDEDGFFSYGDFGWYIVGPAGSPEVEDSEQGKADLDHIARHDPAHVLAVCEAHRRIVELHQNWPVLVETQPTFEPVDSGDPSSFALRASQQIAWLTEQEYRVRFGTEPPTAPMLRALAAIYADRDGFREEWR